MSEWRTGGCHCGAVRISVQVAPDAQAVVCNCSICTKKGFVHYLVEASRFELLQGDDALVEYRFGTGIARHRFCGTCGMHPFYVPRSHPDGFSVNVRCLDGADPLADFTLRPFDGQHWEASIDGLRSADRPPE